MPGDSIYVRRDPAFTGGSPQAVYETLWQEGQRQRMIRRGVFAGAGLVLGVALGAPVSGLALGLLAAGADFFLQWRQRANALVWRRGQRGDARMAGLLRRGLRRRGYTSLNRLRVPDHGQIDHLVIGPGGIWLIHDEAWSPDTEIATYNDKLYIGERSGAKLAEQVETSARRVAALLSKELGSRVMVSPVLAVHGGTMPRRGVLVVHGITVLRARRVVRWIRRHPTAHYGPDQLERLTRTAARILAGGPRGGAGVRGPAPRRAALAQPIRVIRPSPPSG